MAYDAARRHVVLFGGSGRQQWFADTWIWDGALWTQVAETGPEARGRHAMAYDGARQQIVLFGGQAGDDLGDTWVWDGVAWTQVAEVGPPVRHGHEMSYDVQRERVVLFGGAYAGGLRGDTWEWDGEAWTQRAEAGPGDRLGHAMAYDATRARVVLFGGASSEAQVWDDTWEWNGASWTQLAEFGAPASFDAAMVYDGRWTLLFGGAGGMIAAEPGRDVTWEWNGRLWTALSQFGPPARSGHALALDSHRRRIVLFGGCSRVAPSPEASFFGDTWECPARESIFESLTMSPANVDLGGALEAAAAVSEPMGSDFTVQLSASPSGSALGVGLPGTIVIPAGQVVARVTGTVPLGVTPGTHTLTGTAAGVSKSATVQVNVPAPGTMRIVAVLPDPLGSEIDDEAVHLKNLGPTIVSLSGWRIEDADGLGWPLDAADGDVGAGQVTIVTRQQRTMPLPNGGGTIVLKNPAGLVLDRKDYGPAQSGQLIQF
jgi:hypothetical protein